ncbi:spermidine synthase [Arcobacter roscoffensis]|uniref:Spermidine synthase n=1 Tax=Arcobacter roscoffensis TaxID=2961520 RepID=A0ABY5E4M7_9BACT|nr:spermidine synthase [Arcobacter roscoffensis]UTJ06675.1 spermidine synthase [Arcobacter roscoffensis]
MNNNAFNEMMVHVPLCTHKEASNVLIIGSADEELKEQAAKHNKVSNIEFGDKSLLTSKDDKNIDVIILTDVEIDELLLANIERVLKDDGLITFASESFSKNEEKLKADLTLVGEKFWIAMPFRFGHQTSILASKRYHPTADVVLQRSDLLDDLQYYSTEIHSAVFVFPKGEHNALTGIAKR